MAALQTRIFTGATPADATDALWTAISDGSFAVVLMAGTEQPVLMSITHIPVLAAMMQQSSYELHCTAWVESPKVEPHTSGDTP